MLPTTCLCHQRPVDEATSRVLQALLTYVELICLIREQCNRGRQELPLNARPFVLCKLLLRRLPPGQLVHPRCSGKFFLHAVAYAGLGSPICPACVPAYQGGKAFPILGPQVPVVLEQREAALLESGLFPAAPPAPFTPPHFTHRAVQALH
jgi:hypothetical protein